MGEKKSLKQTIEEHIVVFFLGTLVLGFTSGFAANKVILEMQEKTILDKGSFYRKSEIAGRIDYESTRKKILALYSEGKKLQAEIEKDPTILNSSSIYNLRAKSFLGSLIDIRLMGGEKIPVERSAKEIQMIMSENSEYGHSNINKKQKLDRVINVVYSLISTFELIKIGREQ